MYIGFHVKYPLFLKGLNFIHKLSKNAPIQHFMEIRPVGGKMFHAERQMDRQTDRHDEANSRF